MDERINVIVGLVVFAIIAAAGILYMESRAEAKCVEEYPNEKFCEGSSSRECGYVCNRVSWDYFNSDYGIKDSCTCRNPATNEVVVVY